MQTVCLLFGCQCLACCDRIARALRRVKGVQRVDVNLYKATATVVHDESCPCENLVAAVEHIGYLARIQASDDQRRPDPPRSSD